MAMLSPDARGLVSAALPSRARQQVAAGVSVLALLLTALPAGAVDTPKPADLTLRDATGRKVRLRDYRGKAIVLNFWATWCGPCNAEMPLLVEAESRYATRGVVFLGASLDDAKTQDRIPTFLDKHHVKYPVWYGATGDDLDRLAMGEVAPATAFIDPEGYIAARIEGQMRPGEIEERLDWLLGGRAGPPPQTLVKHLSDR